MNKKFLQAITKANSVDEKNYTIDFVMTMEVTDRHGDIVDIDTIDLSYFEKNPVVLPSHDHSALAVGKVIKTWVEVVNGVKQLIGTVQFAVEEYELAKTYWNLYKGGYMSAVSIGFIPQSYKVEPDGVSVRLFGAQIIELSFVAVPANQLALAKSAGISVNELVTASRETIVKEIQQSMIMLKELLGDISTETTTDPDDKKTDDVVDVPVDDPKDDVDVVVHEPDVLTPPVNHQLKALALMNKAIRELGKK